MTGRTATGNMASKVRPSFQFTTSIMVSAPVVVSSVRAANDADEPRKVSISVMSAVRRDTASPDRICE